MTLYAYNETVTLNAFAYRKIGSGENHHARIYINDYCFNYTNETYYDGYLTKRVRCHGNVTCEFGYLESVTYNTQIKLIGDIDILD